MKPAKLPALKKVFPNIRKGVLGVTDAAQGHGLFGGALQALKDETESRGFSIPQTNELIERWYQRAVTALREGFKSGAKFGLEEGFKEGFQQGFREGEDFGRSAKKLSKTPSERKRAVAAKTNKLRSDWHANGLLQAAELLADNPQYPLKNLHIDVADYINSFNHLSMRGRKITAAAVKKMLERRRTVLDILVSHLSKR